MNPFAFFLHAQQGLEHICNSQGCCEALGLGGLPGANGGCLERHVLNPWKHLAQTVCFPKRYAILLSWGSEQTSPGGIL